MEQPVGEGCPDADADEKKGEHCADQERDEEPVAPRGRGADGVIFREMLLQQPVVPRAGAKPEGECLPHTGDNADEAIKEDVCAHADEDHFRHAVTGRDKQCKSGDDCSSAITDDGQKVDDGVHAEAELRAGHLE